MNDYEMEVIHHDLDCNCHRRREWIEVDGKMIPVEFSVDDPKKSPMTQEEKEKVALIIKQGMKDLKK